MADAPPIMLPWWPRDFLSSTRGWPLVARGVYRELLDAQWDMGPLPVAEEELRAIAGASEAEWAIAWPKVEAKLPIKGAGRLNPRMERERAKVMERKVSAAEKARAAAEARWGNKHAPSNAPSNASSMPQAMLGAMLEECPPSPSPSPSPSSSSPSGSSPSETSPHGFTLEPAAPPPAKAKREAGRLTRIPPDLTLTGKWLEVATKHLPEDCDAPVEFVRFQSHFQGNGTTKLDWLATWRTWCLNAKVRMAYARKDIANERRKAAGAGWWKPGDPTGREDLA